MSSELFHDCLQKNNISNNEGNILDPTLGEREIDGNRISEGDSSGNENSSNTENSDSECKNNDALSSEEEPSGLCT